MATDSSHRIIMGKLCHGVFSTVFDRIFFILAILFILDDIHKSLNELEIWPDSSIDYGVKPCTHDQICIRMQILHICKICVRTQIWPCVCIYSRMQNLHVCKSWKICLRPSADLILRIRKICVYANLVM